MRKIDTCILLLCSSAIYMGNVTTAFAQDTGTAVPATDTGGGAALTWQGAMTRQPFRILPGPLAKAVAQWASIAGVQIIYRADEMKKARSGGVDGLMTAADALEAILGSTGFEAVTDTSGAVAIVRRAADATPEILVRGRRGWSLNTGIERTQDDSQPFIVMSRDEIIKSGAPNLESFLRDRLNVNTAAETSEQAQASGRDVKTRGLSQINLRGLGARDTLILVDGRRQPGVNIGNGEINQASITGIPIASIERIEVLASSASGIYGSGASGGVINIVLRRDFVGGELSATYADTTDFAQGQGQIDLTAGMPLEGGRTRLSFSGSWRKSNPLLYGDRAELSQRGIDRVLQNDPALLEGVFAPVPSGRLSNYKSADGSPLRLKPAFGGQTLGSTIGFVPADFAGIARDGVAPLLAGVGKFNYDLPDSAVGRGARSPLLFGSEQISGSLAARREFSSWLTGYVEIGGSKSFSVDYRSASPTTINLSKDAQSNPFDQDINLVLPGGGREVRVRSEQTAYRVLGGVIARLPYDWQAVVDLAYSRSRFVGDRTPPEATDTSIANARNGTIDVLRDSKAFPIDWQYLNAPFTEARSPGVSSTLTPSLRVAGPLPLLRLPGGKPRLTLNLEQSTDRIGEVWTGLNQEFASVITYAPPATQKIQSLYGEIVFPLVGEASNVPAIRNLELRLSARGERYVGDGANAISCFVDGALPTENTFAGCPGTGDTILRDITRNARVDPSISMLWSPIRDIAIRASYTTGYLPPRLTQLVKNTATMRACFAGFDSARGGEPIGAGQPDGCLPPGSAFGGNPDIRPEKSSTWTAGAILTPRFVPGLRVSLDWTHIRKRDNYFDPLELFFFQSPENRRAADLFFAAYPERVQRGPPSDGFAVGPITGLDVSLVNLVNSGTDALDFVVDYRHRVFGGEVNFIGRGTYVKSLFITSFPGQPPVEYAGSMTRVFAGTGGEGTLRWRGSGSLQWSRDNLTLGWQARYFDSYFLNPQRTVSKAQGSAKVSSALYQDASISYRFDFGATMRLGINNLFNRLPPVDATAIPVYYSQFGDVRLRNFYLAVTKSF